MSLTRTSRLRERHRIGHHRELDRVLDPVFPKLRPEPVKCVQRFLVCWMRRPVNAQGTQVAEADADRFAELVQVDVQIHLQARYLRPFDGVSSALRKYRQARFRIRLRAGQKLTFGEIELQIEDKVMPAVPCVVRQ